MQLVGASQVKWNREDRHVLATSHDGDIRVWDLRVSRTNCKGSGDDEDDSAAAEDDDGIDDAEDDDDNDDIENDEDDDDDGNDNENDDEK